MSDDLVVRTLSESDIPAAMRLKEAANWNQTPEDWRRLLELQPEGCFGLFEQGELRASTTYVAYGGSLAWVGMVLTAPEARRRGFGRRLMEHCLQAMDEARIACSKLDATDMGRPLYAALGYQDECSVERWERLPRDETSRWPKVEVRSSPALLEEYLEQDRAVFGVDRSPLLRRLVQEEAAFAEHAFAMGRPGSRAAFFGPCLARSTAQARELAIWYVSRHAGERIFWDLLPENQDAVALACELGFTLVRRLIRMVRPHREAGPAGIAGEVYALAGFEYG
jgi:GNAT superfamily N-acetyltransferase